MSTRDEQELVELARQGDAAAVGALFSRYWRAARAAAFGVTGDFASAEDAASDGCREAFATVASLRDVTRFGAWLRTIVVRKALASRRPREDALSDVAASLPAEGDAIDELVARRELHALLQGAVRQLPDHLREAIALFYFEGYDSEAAARFLDIPPGTLRRRLHDGRARLRRTVGQMVEGHRPMSRPHEERIGMMKRLIDGENLYTALRETMSIRPVPRELVDALARRAAPRHSAPDAELVRQVTSRFRPDRSRASDPGHPVGAVALAIRKALPEFEEWTLDLAESAGRFFSVGASPEDRVRSMLPPGFADGQPGSFIRVTRGLVYVADQMESLYDRLKRNPDESQFLPSRERMRISDVLDLTWMTPGSLDLRSVQGCIERLVAAVLPGVEARFSVYDEPRYRSACQLHLATSDVRAAQGGVLAPWPGGPPEMNAAHVRVFLEPWAAIRSGERVEFESVFSKLPEQADGPSNG